MQSTGKEQSIRIQSSGGLSEDQIQQMVRDAESHAEADKLRKTAIEARNEADTAIISAERSVQVCLSKQKMYFAAAPDHILATATFRMPCSPYVLLN